MSDNEVTPPLKHRELHFGADHIRHTAQLKRDPDRCWSSLRTDNRLQERKVLAL